MFVQYELRTVDSAQWHENLGRTQVKSIYCHHILTFWLLRAPQWQQLSWSNSLLILQGSSLSPTFLVFLIFFSSALVSESKSQVEN